MEAESGEGEAVPSSYLKRCSPAPSSHWGIFSMIWEDRNLYPRMQRCVAQTRVIATLLFMYPQVCEIGSVHFFARRMAIRLSVASTLNPRRPSTEATKGVTLQRCLRQEYRYFFFLYLSAVSRHFLVFWPVRRWSWYSRNACREYCQSPASRGL